MKPYIPYSYSIFTRSGKGSECDPGLKGKLSREDYDEISALSNSVIKKWDSMSSIPSRFLWWLKDRWEDTDSSAALGMGSALDCLLLEPDQLPHKFTVFTQAGPKRITPQHRENNPGRIVLTHEQFDTAIKMAEALRASKHTSYGKDFNHCGKQVAVAELFGAPWKCEFDLWTERTPDILDVKSARDVGQEAFGRAAVDFGYYQQATVYISIARSLGFDKKCFNFLCVENAPPYTVKPYRFRPWDNEEHMEIFDGCVASLRSATDSLRSAMDNRFEEDNRWQDISAPGWYVNQCRRASGVNSL